MRAAIQHPFGVTVLAITVTLVLAMAFLPALDRWSSTPMIWMLLGWGGLWSGVAVFAISRTRPTPSEPELRELETVRRMIYSRIRERKSTEGWSRSVVTRTLEEAHDNLERRIMPAMAQLLELQRKLTDHLTQFEDGDMPSPAPEVLKRLRTLHSRRDAIIKECVLQASNAAATLIEMIQEQEQSGVAEEADGWARDLLDTYEAILEAMRPGSATDETDGEAAGPGPDATETSIREAVDSMPERPMASPPDSFVEEVNGALETVLRKLNRPPDLAACELLALIPETVNLHCDGNRPSDALPPTPLELGVALHGLIVREIDLLKPVGGGVNSSNPASEHYMILHEQYVLGRKVDQIYPRMYLSRRGYFDRRLEAVAALGSHLAAREFYLRDSAEIPVASL